MELGLEAGVVFPARDGVRIDVQDVRYGLDAVAREEKADGSQLARAERSVRRRTTRWVRFAQIVVGLWRGVGFRGAVWRVEVREDIMRERGGDGAREDRGIAFWIGRWVHGRFPPLLLRWR